MATFETTTMRAALTTQALTTLGTCPLWDSKLTTFLAAETLALADAEFGDYAKADQNFDHSKARVQARFGIGWHTIPAARDLHAPARQMMDEAEDVRSKTYLRPMWAAERELALTPAPTLAAAIYKTHLIAREEVWNDCRVHADLMQIVRDDFARLTGQVA